MDNKKKNLRNLGLLIFVIGIALGMVFQGSAVWGDFEASLFDSTLPADAALDTLSCPVVINSHEQGTVSASFTNDASKVVNIRIRTHITDGLVTLMREENTIVPVNPGETGQAHWLVFPENAVWRHFILVRVFQFSAFQTPSRTGSCGILVIDFFNLSGNGIVIFIIATSFLCMVLGAGLLLINSRPFNSQALSAAAGLGLLGALVITGIFVSLSGSYMAGGGLIVLTILLLAAMLPFAFKTTQI